MDKHDVTMDEVQESLENGRKVRDRKKGIVERWWQQGRTIVIVVVEDYGEYWNLRSVSRIRATKRHLRLLRQ